MKTATSGVIAEEISSPDFKLTSHPFVEQILFAAKYAYLAQMTSPFLFTPMIDQKNVPAPSLSHTHLEDFLVKMPTTLNPDCKNIDIIREYTQLPFQVWLRGTEKPIAILKADQMLATCILLGRQDFCKTTSMQVIEKIQEGQTYVGIAKNKEESKFLDAYMALDDEKLMGQLKKELPGRRNLINNFLGKTSVFIPTLLDHFYKKSNEFRIEDVKTENKHQLKKAIDLIENHISLLFYTPYASQKIISDAENSLDRFIKISRTFFQNLLGILFLKGSVLDLMLHLYLRIEKIYVVSELATQYLNKRINLIRNYELCMFLITSYVSLREKGVTKQEMFLQVNDLERLLLSCFEILETTPEKNTKENLIYLNYTAFKVYMINNKIEDALSRFDQSLDDMVELLLNMIQIKSNTKMTFTPTSFFEQGLEAFQLALDSKLRTPANLISKTNKLKNSLSKLLNPSLSSEKEKEAFRQVEFYINKLISECKDFIQKCRDIKQTSSNPTCFEYKIAEAHLFAPNVVQGLQPISPPSVTITIGEEQILLNKQIKYKKWLKRRRDLEKKTHADVFENQEPQPNMCSEIYSFVNPVSHRIVEAYINFTPVASWLSIQMMGHLVGILAKCRVGLGPNKIKPIKTTEDRPDEKENIYWKLKGSLNGLSVRCYGYEVNGLFEFGIFDFNSHKGSKDKFYNPKLHKNKKIEFPH